LIVVSRVNTSLQSPSDAFLLSLSLSLSLSFAYLVTHRHLIININININFFFLLFLLFSRSDTPSYFVFNLSTCYSDSSHLAGF
ncbi:hypothetical protein F5050DRAFT_1750651, partial [Lentinula boryana]